LTVSDGGTVIIVENHNTAKENSDYFYFPPKG